MTVYVFYLQSSHCRLHGHLPVGGADFWEQSGFEAALHSGEDSALHARGHSAQEGKAKKEGGGLEFSHTISLSEIEKKIKNWVCGRFYYFYFMRKKAGLGFVY